MSTEPIRTAIPNANNPRLVLRLVHWLARGVRSSRALQEVMGVELRTTQYYLQAADWLGLVEPGPEHLLTPLGLEMAFGRSPEEVYAKAIWAQPFVRGLVAGTGRALPGVDEVTVAIARAEPDLAAATVRRRASAVRSLMAPAIVRPKRPRLDDAQLTLPLVAQNTSAQRPLTPGSARDADPDVYRRVYEGLLDHGELTLGQLRGTLDRAGVSDLPIGGYVDLLLARGDARRLDERLVITEGGVQRRSAASSTTGVILSHHRYRQWLEDVHAASMGDRQAEIRNDQVATRFKAWDIRLLGGPAEPATLQRKLDRVLLDRSLASFPVSGDAGRPAEPIDRSFLDCWEEAGLVLCLPPSLATLQGGLSRVNQALTQARQGTGGVSAPGLASRPMLVHGGLIHPGEPQPRSVPDGVSLRQRVLMNAPYAALVAALLLLHRQSPDALELANRRGQWRIHRKGRALGEALLVLDDFAVSRGWVPCRRTTGGLPMGELLKGLEAIGICHVFDELALLAERLFHHLRHDPEQMEVHALLAPLAEALEAYLMVAEPLEDPRVT
ncbi:MAG: hypothetical protein AB8H79_09840 [Myxococcota bacterium]